MTSPSMISPLRPFPYIVRVDKETRDVIERKRRTAGPRRLSKSEAAYLILLAGVQAEKEAAAATAEPSSDGEGWTGEERRQSA